MHRMCDVGGPVLTSNWVRACPCVVPVNLAVDLRKIPDAAVKQELKSLARDMRLQGDKSEELKRRRFQVSDNICTVGLVCNASAIRACFRSSQLHVRMWRRLGQMEERGVIPTEAVLALKKIKVGDQKSGDAPLPSPTPRHFVSYIFLSLFSAHHSCLILFSL